MILILLIFTGSRLKPQEAHLLHAMRQIPQSSVSNAAYIPPYEAHFNFLFPAAHAWVGNSTFKWNDLVKRRVDGSFYLDYDHVSAKLKNRNHIITGFRYEPFSFGYRFERNYLSLSSQVRTEIFLQYSASMLDLMNDGVNAITGNRVDFDETRVFGMAWMEHSIAYARNFNERISAGVRFKFLNGVAGVHLAENQASLSISNNSTDYILMSNLVLNASYHDTDRIRIAGNNGFAIDFGIRISPVEEFDLVAGFNDLGRINWKTNLQNFKAVDTVLFNLTGVNLNELFSNLSDFGAGIGTIHDSLNRQIEFGEFEAKFKTPLPFNFHAGGMYRFTERNQAGLMMNFSLLDGQIHPSASLLFQHNFGRVFALTTALSYYNQRVTNIGLGWSLNLGFFQMYMLSGNILPAFHYSDAYNAGIQFGFNFLIGSLGKNNEPIIIEIRDDFLVL